MRIDGLTTLNEELFFSVLREVNQKGGLEQRPTIFIHGYNTSFEQAVTRAAQFGHDLGIAQGIGLFSWPSRATEVGYARDEASVERNKYALAEFIEQFTSAFPTTDINLVAHSMGCRCLLGATEVLALKSPSAASLVRQVVLAAADVDAAIMKNQGVYVTEQAERTTSYIGDKDKALKLSKWLHGYDRVGLAPPAFKMEDLDTVLVNDQDLGPFAHGYIAQSRAVLADIHAMFTSNLPPQSRFSIRSETLKGTQIWKIAD